MAIFPYLDLIITLRCNAKCINCIEFCNMGNVTGLDYSDSDMTLGQIDNFINQVKSFNRENVIENLFVTGGEPLLHADVEKIFFKVKELYDQKYITNIFINSNKIITPPTILERYIVNFSPPSINKDIHNVSLLHPTEFSKRLQTYDSCNHYRKERVVLNYQGYSLCCAGDAYIRLFRYDDLIVDQLPASLADFPTQRMNKICIHCPYGNHETLPLERNEGQPVSRIFAIEAAKNRTGRKITKRFPEI